MWSARQGGAGRTKWSNKLGINFPLINNFSSCSSSSSSKACYKVVCLIFSILFLKLAPPDTYYNDLTAEDTEWFTEPGGPDAADAEYQRLADTAIDSWRLHQNEKEMKKISSRLSLSGRGFGETTELKGFIDPKS